MVIMKKLWRKRKILRSLISTIYFNFHYLPFKQAIKLPILLYKPHLLSMKGKIKIESPISFGMITMGFHACSLYANNGITYENNGGCIIFKGKTNIGNDCYISLGKKAQIVVGNDFIANAGLKLVSYRSIVFGESTRLGWGTLIMDTNFHPLYDMKKKKFKTASGSIEIGDYNWFGTQCRIMHSVKTPHRCIFGMNSTITRNSEMKSYCIMGGNPIKILTEDVMLDYKNEIEKY